MSRYRAYMFVSLQAGVLEQDALEVLSLIRSMKNHLAPINRIPPDVFSLVLGYWSDTDMDEILITMTHVCHGWRELLIARTWLWARLDCTNVDKTRVYIERAKLSRMRISLFEDQDQPYLEQAFLLAVPHIRRLKSLTIVGASDIFQNLTKLLTIPTPSLEELTIVLWCDPAPNLDNTLFSGAHSLRRLCLRGSIADLPWKNLRNLTSFELCTPYDPIVVTRFLAFLENAPLLRDIRLFGLIPTSSNAPPGRVVFLPHLEELSIYAHPTHSVLNHISIPVNALLTLDFSFSGDKSPLPDCLPMTAKNLQNLSWITKVNLCFDGRKRLVQLSGPSGALDICGRWESDVKVTPSLGLDYQIMRSLDYFTLSGIERMMVTKYRSLVPTIIENSTPYYTLDRMGDLRTLTLVQCNDLPFIFTLDPGENYLRRLLCPKLEELVLYIETHKPFNITELMDMARRRASKNAKLSLITIIGLGDLVSEKANGVLKLRKHVTRVEYRTEKKPPQWSTTTHRKSFY